MQTRTMNGFVLLGCSFVCQSCDLKIGMQGVQSACQCPQGAAGTPLDMSGREPAYKHEMSEIRLVKEWM